MTSSLLGDFDILCNSSSALLVTVRHKYLCLLQPIYAVAAYEPIQNSQSHVIWLQAMLLRKLSVERSQTGGGLCAAARATVGFISDLIQELIEADMS